MNIMKGTTVTIYMGIEKKRVDENRKYIFETKYRHTAKFGWHIHVTKKDGSRGTVIDGIDAAKDSWEYGDNLYLGAHMINDPYFSMKEGDAYTQANCTWHSNCEVIASRDIEAGEEITVKYQAEVITKRVANKDPQVV